MSEGNDAWQILAMAASALSKLNIRVALEATPMAIEGSEMNNPNS